MNTEILGSNPDIDLPDDDAHLDEQFFFRCIFLSNAHLFLYGDTKAYHLGEGYSTMQILLDKQ